MPERLIWTETADNTIIQMRAYGATWAIIGQTLGLSRNTIIERGRRLNALGGPRPMPRPPRTELDNPNRPPLRAGHPITWGLLTNGTLLDGAPFVPLPPIRPEVLS